LRGDFTATPTGYTPTQVRRAYGFDQITNQGAGQTVAIVDAFDDPNIESDLGVFSTQFGLPSCTTANGCFQKVFAAGTAPRPNRGWAFEISLDVEWVHAIAPQAKIILVEARSSSLADLLAGVDAAVAHGASVVSMSFGGGETSSEVSSDSHFSASNVTFTASSGDSGTGASYPAASPLVVSVGGTHLNIDSNGNYLSETAWSGSGGGQSGFEVEPLYQAGYPIPNDPAGKRGIPDVSYDGDPASGFPIYASYLSPRGWIQVGGTSAGAPQWAALFGIVNSVRAGNGKAPLNSTTGILYNTLIGHTNYSSNYNDVTSGTNGSCGTLCTAVTGYDYVTGLGTPKANTLIPALAAQP
jgi:subtilase family serine protease